MKEDNANEQNHSLEIREHLVNVEQVAETYHTKVDFRQPHKSFGLSEEEASLSSSKYGKNRLTPPKQPHVVFLFLSELRGMFNVLLLSSGFLSFILFALYLGIILVIIAFGNAFVDFYQKYHTCKILESFLELAPPTCTIIRQGSFSVVPAEEIVVGDILYLKAGDRVPSDCRLFHVGELKVDNSAITGESEPQERTVAPVTSSPLEASNLIFCGTTVSSGEGYGIVIRTADHSIFGQIARLAIQEKTPQSQLEREINLYVRYLAAIAILIAIVLLGICLLLGYDLSITFGFSVGIFVSFVPQGLPVTVSTLLTFAARRMAEKKVLVKNLQTVETLGAITLLATDKTGTLTQNKMVVVGLWANRKQMNMADLSHPGNKDMAKDFEPNLASIAQASVLCSRAKALKSQQEGNTANASFCGDATEVSLLNFATKFFNVDEMKDNHEKVFEIPFNSTNKWHLAICRVEHPNGHFVAYLKGAPERVVSMCHDAVIGKQTHNWDDELSREFNSNYEYFAGQGRRLIGIAYKCLDNELFPSEFNFEANTCPIPLNQFTFLGMFAIMDPPKKGVRKAVAALRTAGIQVVMVTGDHPLTAEAIARQIGLITGETIIQASWRLRKPLQEISDEEYDTVVVHGEQLNNLSKEDWDRILAKKEIVFARTSPQQKLEIVTRFQEKGHIVGASGDGINDSPALKKADLGISMNESASDVSKEASSMILLDDNFPSIVHGVAEGRLIFSNLKKSIRYTITHTMPEVLAFVLFVIFAIPVPVNSLLLLLIDLGSELAPALSFAFDLPEKDLMLVPPRKVLCSMVGGQNQNKIMEGRGLVNKFRTMIKNLAPEETGERLVDLDMIVWSFFEAGLIEALGCFGAYLLVFVVFRVPIRALPGSARTYWSHNSPELVISENYTIDAKSQMKISGTSQSAYYAGIVICQLFVLWVTKQRFEYPFRRAILKNKVTFLGAAIAIVIAAIVIYVPGLNNIVLGGGPVPFIGFLPSLAAGCFLVAYECLRIFLRHRGWFGGVPRTNVNLVDLVRTTSSFRNQI